MRSLFRKIWSLIQHLVLTDTKTSRVVATASVLVERKFIRTCGKVHQPFRGSIYCDGPQSSASVPRKTLHPLVCALTHRSTGWPRRGRGCGQRLSRGSAGQPVHPLSSAVSAQTAQSLHTTVAACDAGQQRRLVEAVTERARGAGCYKIILDCSEDNAAFYSKCGLSRKDIQMVSAQQAACPVGVQSQERKEVSAVCCGVCR